jgi:hypothetical protein
MTLRLLILGAVCLVGLVQAQEYQNRSEVFGSIGYSSVSDDEGSLGGGISGGGGAGLRLTPRFGIEFDVNTLRNRRTTSGNSLEFVGHGFLASGSGLLYLRRGRVQPYLAFGVGVLHYTSDNRFSDAPRVSRSGTGVAANAGLGTLFFVTPHVSLRPDLRMIAGSAGSTQVIEGPVMLRTSFGLGYHW